MEYKSIAEALHKYLLTCPLLGDHPLGVDWLPDHSVAFSIDTTPASQIIQRYFSGSTMRQYQFVLRSISDYGADTLQNLASSALYEQLAAWFEEQTRQRNFPDLGPGRTVQSIEAQSTGYLMTAAPDVGRYQIQCRLIYYEKGTRRR